MNKRIIILQAAMLAASFSLSVNPARAATATAVSNIGTVDTRVADIAVECPVGTNLTDGSASINCGTAYVGSPAGSVTFTVRNTGTAALTLTNPVGKEGANASEFALGNIATSVAAGGSTTFTVTFTPTAAGARTATLRIASNDADENPFDISLSGTGISPLIAPVITWANPAAITYGTALSATQLKAKANVPGQLVYSPALGAKLPAGNQTLNVTFTPTDAAHYATAQKSVTLTVNKAAATVTLAGLRQTYNGQPRVVTATTVPAGLNVSITYNGSTTVPVNPGSYAVLAAVVNDNATGSKSGTLAVAKGAQSITFPTPPALRFGNADHALTATASSGLTVSYASSAPTVATIVGGNMLHITGAGKVTITASQAGNPNWNPAPAVAKALTIGKRSQTIAFAAFPGHTVGEPDFSPGATATSGLTVTYASASPAVASIVAGKVHLVGKGTVVITASQAGNTSWDVAVPVKQTLTVAGKPQTITFPLLPEKGYGAADFASGATVSSGLAINYTSSNPLVASIVAGKIHITGIGTTTITARQAGNTLWAAAPEATRTLPVIKGTPVITWANPAAITYGTALTATQLNAKASVPGTFLYSPGLGSKLSVGAQTLNVSFTPTDTVRYNTATKSVPLTVNKAAATVTLVGLSQTYTGQPRVVTATTVPAGLHVDITYNGSPDAPVNVGSYPVVATVNDPNAGGTKSGTLVIGKGNQTISFASLLPMHVGDADRPLTAIAASGLPVSYASSTPTVATIVDNNKLHAVATGSAFITATQAGDANWNAALPFKQLLTVNAAPPPPAPDGFALIPAGNFKMGDAVGDGYDDEKPVHTVNVSAFYMAKYEVTKALWDEVRTWGASHGYTDLPTGDSKAASHPVVLITWYEMVKWCNARSEKDGLTPCYYTNAAQTVRYRVGQTDLDSTMVKWNSNGYRLPTEAEWEKAARGGLIGKRFPWGSTISHSQANYNSSGDDSYDVSPTRGYHPTFATGDYPYTAPVGSFAPNGYGLYDVTGNVWEACWDWYGSYSATSQTDPRGPNQLSDRIYRGGGWAWGNNDADLCRVSNRAYDYNVASYAGSDFGFRLARSVVP